RAGASSYTTNWPATSIFIPAVSTSWTCTKTSGPRALHRAEDIGSALKGSVNVCQRQLVHEVLGPLVTRVVRNFGRKGATSIQRGSNASLRGRVANCPKEIYPLCKVPVSQHAVGWGRRSIHPSVDPANGPALGHRHYCRPLYRCRHLRVLSPVWAAVFWFRQRPIAAARDASRLVNPRARLQPS